MNRSPPLTLVAAPIGEARAQSLEDLSRSLLPIFCGLALAVAVFLDTPSALAEPLAAPDEVAQADFQTKRRTGPIVAPGPVEEYELNKGPLTPGPVEGTELEKGPIVASPEPPGAGGAPPDMSDMLKAHNERRARHCVPPLAWSPALAQAAQAYAEKCILGQHGSTGENMANWVTIKNGEPVLPARTNRQIFEDVWYCEINNYDFNAPQIVGGFKQNCDPPVNGHFTQVVWKGTQQLGCGRATCTINGQQGTNWVCRYSPEGNSGPLAENVPPPCQ
jgi:Cysteine-rich secretory protein family